MSAWVFWAVYLAGYVFTYRRMFVAMMEHDARAFTLTPVGEHRTGNAVAAMGACLFWPVVIVAWVIHRVLTPYSPSERKADLDKREREIERMERELGIERP